MADTDKTTDKTATPAKGKLLDPEKLDKVAAVVAALFALLSTTEFRRLIAHIGSIAVNVPLRGIEYLKLLWHHNVVAVGRSILQRVLAVLVASVVAVCIVLYFAKTGPCKEALTSSDGIMPLIAALWIVPALALFAWLATIVIGTADVESISFRNLRDIERAHTIPDDLLDHPRDTPAVLADKARRRARLLALQAQAVADELEGLHGPGDRSPVPAFKWAILAPFAIGLIEIAWAFSLGTWWQVGRVYTTLILMVGLATCIIGYLAYIGVVVICMGTIEKVGTMTARVVNTIYHGLAATGPFVTFENAGKYVGDITADVLVQLRSLAETWPSTLIIGAELLFGFALVWTNWAFALAVGIVFLLSFLGFDSRSRTGQDLKVERQNSVTLVAKLLFAAAFYPALCIIDSATGEPFTRAASSVVKTLNSFLSMSLSWGWIGYFLLVLIVAAIVRRVLKGEDRPRRFARGAVCGTIVAVAVAMALGMVLHIGGAHPEIPNPFVTSAEACSVIRAQRAAAVASATTQAAPSPAPAAAPPPPAYVPPPAAPVYQPAPVAAAPVRSRHSRRPSAPVASATEPSPATSAHSLPGCSVAFDPEFARASAAAGMCDPRY